MLEKSISDQLKRDVLIEGSAACNSVHVLHNCLIMGLNESEIKAGSAVGSVVGKGKVKSKEKTLSLVGDGGGTTGVVALNRLHS